MGRKARPVVPSSASKEDRATGVMSTLFFDVTALSNVLACIRANLPECGLSDVLTIGYAVGLQHYSVANAAAFSANYGESREAYAASDITLACNAREGRCNREAAIGFFRLAAYNLDDFETPALLATLRLLREAAGITPAEMRGPYDVPGEVPPTCEASDFSVVRL